jgi:hypothetical protein
MPPHTIFCDFREKCAEIMVRKKEREDEKNDCENGATKK